MTNKSSTKILLPVYLDLEKKTEFGDETILSIYEGRIKQDKKGLIQRFKSTAELGMSYDTPSVRLFHEARNLFILGYFKSTIMVCRSTAEYLAYGLFISLTDIKETLEEIEKIAEDLNFRKIVNDHLFRKKNPLIDNKGQSQELFNNLYTLCNDWVHPKIKQRNLNVESEAKKTLGILRELINTEMNVLNDYDTTNGVLKKKPTSRIYKRGIKLGDKL